MGKNVVGERLVRGLWKDFGRLRWEHAEGLLGRGFTAVWPQSRERMRGAGNFIAVNRNYPGKHDIKVNKVTSHGDQVISEVFIRSVLPGNKRLKLFAVSFFTIRNGKIASAREYWSDTYPAPSWRKRWAEKY